MRASENTVGIHEDFLCKSELLCFQRRPVFVKIAVQDRHDDVQVRGIHQRVASRANFTVDIETFCHSALFFQSGDADLPSRATDRARPSLFKDTRRVVEKELS